MDTKNEETFHWEEKVRRDRKHLSFFERVVAERTTQVIVEGKENPEKYESIVIREHTFTDENVIWICFLGVTDVAERDLKFTNLFFGLPDSIPNKIDMAPRQGTVYIFHGPTAIVGYTPEQCIQATEEVFQSVELIVVRNPRKRICIFSFSAGTHLGFYAANQLGKRLGHCVDKMIVVSAGAGSMARGIFSIPPIAPLARDLLARGITENKYEEAIKNYAHSNNLDYLPSGRDLVIHAGTRDAFVPIQGAGGSDELVSRLREIGKNPTYIIHKNMDHITLPLWLAVSQLYRKNPYDLY